MSKNTPKIKVKVNQIVNGSIHTDEQEFDDMEQVLAHLGQNPGHAYKVYNSKGELEHSGSRKQEPKKHRNKHKDDDEHDTYA